MSERTNLEVLAVALYLLGGDRHPVDTEDIAVKANELAPGRFAWRKYPDQINLELVRVYLSDLKKKSHGGLVHGSGRSGWMLTSGGLDSASRLAFSIRSGNLAREAMSPAERRRIANERARMLESSAYVKYQRGRHQSITKREAEDLFRVDDYVVGAARDRKVERALTTFSDDPDLASLLAHAAGVLRGGASTDGR